MRIKKYPLCIGTCEFCRNSIIAKNSGFVKPNRRFCSKSCHRIYRNKTFIWTDEIRKKLSVANTGKKHLPRTTEQRDNYKNANLGEKSHFWKGGITKKTQQYRCSAKAREFRIKVFERDNYTCIICNVRSGKGKAVILNADHIKPWSFFPELRYDINNGRTLCLDCHKKTDTFGSKAVKNFSKVLK
jgi:5-methylcytosine-specific restriction endonuclease McrA